jgi:NarL family two-component system response regulator LiaR
MPGMDGIQATQQIKARFPNIQVIVITSYDETNLVNKALQAGAIGYLLKNVSASELGNAIRNAKQNRPTLAPEATQALIDATTHEKLPDFDITDRELDALRYMVKGLSNAEIAQQLQISRFTVKNHISSIFSKLDVASRTEAATLAIQHHLVELE